MLTLSGLDGRLRSGGMLRPFPPVGRMDMPAPEREARMILTDSGGVREEGHFVGAPAAVPIDRFEEARRA